MNALRRFFTRPSLTPDLPIWVRIPLGIGVASAGVAATLVGLFVGSIEYTGCFFSCGDPNRLGGTLILAAAALSATLALAGLWWGFADKHWATAWRWPTAFLPIGFLAAHVGQRVRLLLLLLLLGRLAPPRVDGPWSQPVGR